MKRIKALVLAFIAVVCFLPTGCKNAESKEYTITFINESKVLQESTVKEGEMPVFIGETPTKESDLAYDYSFSEWQPLLKKATKNATYTAVFTKTNAESKEYKITFINENRVLQETTVQKGEMPAFIGATPTKESDFTYDYSFSEWQPLLEKATKNATYTAVFTKIKIIPKYEDSVIKKISGFTGKDNYVKWLGRNCVYDDYYLINNTASGFEINFFGTALSANIVSKGYNATFNPQLAVYVDGATDNSTIITLPPQLQTKNTTLISGLDKGYHNVKVYKITEPYASTVGVKDISVDGFFAKRLNGNAKKLKITAYGDSITVGCNNQKATGRPDSGDNFGTKTQNGMQTYATYSAQDLNADISIFAKTGIGIYNSWGDMNFVMLNYYNKVYCNTVNHIDNTTNTPTYDFSEKEDIILINLGTNDIWNKVSKRTLLVKYKLLVSNLRAKNADAKIIICDGMMISDLSYDLKNYAAEEANNGLYYLGFGKCSNGHPSKAEHRAYGTILTNKIKEIMAK